MDDLVTGASDEEEVMQLYSEAKRILKMGAFNPQKFCTSSTALQLGIDNAGNRPENSQGASPESQP